MMMIRISFFNHELMVMVIVVIYICLIIFSNAFLIFTLDFFASTILS